MTMLPTEEPEAYYRTHGLITDPGAQSRYLDDLPENLSELCRAVRGLVIHYQSDALVGCDLPAERFDEIRTRTLALMITRLVELDPHPLTLARPPERRLIGCCRDAATLVCATLRHRGVPARVRVGFASYLIPNLFVDHWVAEYWNREHQRWILVDAEQEVPVRGADGSIFDACDVPRNQFLVAGAAWQACRAGRQNSVHFGYDPQTTGMGVIKSNLLHDLACLNKVELTPWDFWGLGLTELEQHSKDDLALLDHIAVLTQGDTDGFLEMRGLYGRNSCLRVPATITTFNLADEKIDTHIGLPP
jgi:hypothetical protein